MKKILAKPSHTFRSYDFSHLSIGDTIEARQGQKYTTAAPWRRLIPIWD